MNLISISNLSKTYHTESNEIEAISNISFNIKEGEILSIIGASGCGKSTILNILTNLEEKDSGIIKNYKPLVIGYMMQNDCLLPWLTVKENALIGLKLKKLINKDNIEYVDSLIKKYGLEEFKDNYPDSLSGGMRQRVLRSG